MIVFLATPEHGYPHLDVVAHSTLAKVELLPYPAAFSLSELPRATYVFTDLDRLSLPELRVAGELYRALQAGGAHTLNDPAHVPSRFGLLRMLYEAGINKFDAYRVEERVQPERWPVFLRCEGDHRAPLSGLLNDWTEACAAIARALDQGHPLPGLLLVEYAGEPVRPGIYRRLSGFQVGASRFAEYCVHDDNWLVKYGKLGLAPTDLYAEELRFAQTHPHADALAAAFALARIDYGRADYGIVAGKVQIYEINTNPVVKFASEHPSPMRVETYGIVKRNYLEALRLVDTPEGGAPVPLTARCFERYRQRASRGRGLAAATHWH